VNRESLYRMLSEKGNPRLSSLSAVLGSIGLRLQIAPSKGRDAARGGAGRRTPRTLRMAAWVVFNRLKTQPSCGEVPFSPHACRWFPSPKSAASRRMEKRFPKAPGTRRIPVPTDPARKLFLS